jgi:hypothetical protein
MQNQPAILEPDPVEEIARLKKLITAAQTELQYATVSNCPMHWIKIAQEILAKADQPNQANVRP